jgi:hypothetical protein
LDELARRSVKEEGVDKPASFDATLADGHYQLVIVVDFIERLAWNGDEFELGGVRFQAKGAHEHDAWQASSGFLLYKSRPLIEDYARFWATRPGFHATNLFELGVWEGGGTVFWFEWLQPEKHVAVDALDREDSPHFREYVDGRGLSDRIRTHWRVDQADREKLLQIAAAEFFGPLDLVIDDASHELERTQSSYETLFPLLRPGGLYVIEDWNWGLIPAFVEDPANQQWVAERTPPTRMVVDLLEQVGGGGGLEMASLTVFHNFAVIEKR